jgi:hypothetical protein
MAKRRIDLRCFPQPSAHDYARGYLETESLPKTKFAADSALEGTGFEPSVPLFAKRGLSAVAGRTDKLDADH